jgi:hypothetical protein
MSTVCRPAGNEAGIELAGFVFTPDWKWSSARYYRSVPPRQQHPDLPMIHGLPEDTIS